MRRQQWRNGVRPAGRAVACAPLLHFLLRVTLRFNTKTLFKPCRGAARERWTSAWPHGGSRRGSAIPTDWVGVPGLQQDRTRPAQAPMSALRPSERARVPPRCRRSHLQTRERARNQCPERERLPSRQRLSWQRTHRRELKPPQRSLRGSLRASHAFIAASTCTGRELGHLPPLTSSPTLGTRELEPTAT